NRVRGEGSSPIPPNVKKCQHLRRVHGCSMIENLLIRQAPARVHPRRRKRMAGAEVRRIGFLGAGKMATALARGWLAARLASSDRLLASDPVPQARQAFDSETGV